MIYNSENGTVTLTIEELASAIAKAISQVKVYVLESEITAAQQAVRTVVQQANIDER